MNKELIKKYKAEFNHWLNNGEVLSCAIKNKLNGFVVDWQPMSSYTAKWDDENIAYIINDKYVEFRKAGIEGKQLQVCYPDSTNPTTWYDKSYHKISWSDSQLVRIKPEPTIKVDDWLFNLQYKTYHRVNKVLSDKVELNEFNVLLSAINNHNYKLWKPEVGEWCVIDEVTPNNKNFIVQKWEENAKWTPIPYTGPIPYFIKD